jgi:hypothetical protein
VDVIWTNHPTTVVDSDLEIWTAAESAESAEPALLAVRIVERERDVLGHECQLRSSDIYAPGFSLYLS